jgi:hypothetical protein
MVNHIEIMDNELRRMIRQKRICLGGNRRLKIYGMLDCKSGKRMKKENRVFFKSETEAIQQGFRPCGHCLKIDYHNHLLRSLP